MTQLSEIGFLIKKEMLLEWRQKYALGGILLYVSSTVFVVFLSFVKVLPEVWNALFWVIVLFASVNAVVKSFVQENSARQLYFYQLANPTAVIFSKIIYNTGLLLLLSFTTFVFMALMVGNPVKDTAQYMLSIGLGSIGFSITFTFISAIASKTTQSATLMAILSFPVVLPILISLVKLSKMGLRLEQSTSGVSGSISNLLAIDAILLAMCVILFPYLWKE
jgi:heme exporter protein B